MSWDRVILTDGTGHDDLRPLVDDLFTQQRATWVALRDAQAALSEVRTKRLTLDGAEIVVQANPGRVRSTHAETDPAVIARRPCFLCPDNMPDEERGISVGDLVLLPNPYPVIPRHCTIPASEHCPQQLASHLASMLCLARALGPEMLVFYNGPRCGASVPNHFHLQACESREIPLLMELPLEGVSRLRCAHFSFGRSLLVAADPESAAVEEFVERTLDLLRNDDGVNEEPLLNLLLSYRNGRYICVLMPRSVHRPACYFQRESNRVGVSPAALEMAGILVVSNPDHFDRVDVDTARSIYAEVSLEPARFARLTEHLL